MASLPPAGLEVDYNAARRFQEPKTRGVNINSADLVDMNHSKYVVDNQSSISREPMIATTPYLAPSTPRSMPIRIPSGRPPQSLLTTSTSPSIEERKSFPLSSIASLRGKEDFRMIDEENRRRRNEKKILCLAPQTFWILMGGLIVIFAGGIGGSVAGGILASKSSKKATVTNSTDPARNGSQSTHTTLVAFSATTSAQTTLQTTQSSSSSSAAAAAASASPTIYPVASPCNGNLSASGEILISGTSQFQLYCNTNWPAGAQYGNPNITDITSTDATSMDDCLAACVSYNGEQGSELCMAVTIEKAVDRHCILKTGQGTNDTSTSGGIPLDAAFLIN